MPKWSEMLTRLIPWLVPGDTDDERQLQEETLTGEREQHELAPYIADQTEYLISKGLINGFSGQLRLGFERRSAEE